MCSLLKSGFTVLKAGFRWPRYSEDSRGDRIPSFQTVSVEVDDGDDDDEAADHAAHEDKDGKQWALLFLKKDTNLIFRGTVDVILRNKLQSSGKEISQILKSDS